MTVEEAQYLHGTKTFITSAGASLFSLSRAIYESDDPIYHLVLRVLNPRVCWASIEPGTQIRYIDANYVVSLS